MWSRPESDDSLVRRLLPSTNPNAADRSEAWSEWQESLGSSAVMKFIQIHNNTAEPDEDILQDALITAYIEVERGRYERRDGVPFTAYVKGIARNKIREARRRERGYISLEDISQLPAEGPQRQPEASVERREQQRALHKGLASLPTQRRQVLERFICGESTAEIAIKMAMTEELVRQHKSRGLRSLRHSGAFGQQL